MGFKDVKLEQWYLNTMLLTARPNIEHVLRALRFAIMLPSTRTAAPVNSQYNF